MLDWARGTVGATVVARLIIVVVVSVGVGAVVLLARSLRGEEDTFWDADVTEVVVVLNDGEAGVVVTLQLTRSCVMNRFYTSSINTYREVCDDMPLPWRCGALSRNMRRVGTLRQSPNFCGAVLPSHGGVGLVRPTRPVRPLRGHVSRADTDIKKQRTFSLLSPASPLRLFRFSPRKRGTPPSCGFVTYSIVRTAEWSHSRKDFTSDDRRSNVQGRLYVQLPPDEHISGG